MLSLCSLSHPSLLLNQTFPRHHPELQQVLPKPLIRGGGQHSAPLPAHLHLLPDVLPVGEEVVQGVLGIFHVAAVLAINQQPGEGEITDLTGNAGIYNLL